MVRVSISTPSIPENSSKVFVLKFSQPEALEKLG
jgi:hypothetical protein